MAFLKFIVLPWIALMGMLPITVKLNVITGIGLSSYFGYWFLDTLLNEHHSYWFKGIAIVSTIVCNAMVNSDKELGQIVSGFFSTGFIVALIKFWLI